MVLPLIGAAIGAGGTIVSGILGANAASDAAEKNWQINLLNYYQREREREDRIRESAANKREQQLGFSDSDGNRTRFVPGVGWVSERGARGQRLADLQQQEQLNVLTKDLPMRRRFMDRNEERSRKDESMADTLRADLRDLRRLDDRELASMLFNIATNNINESFDNATETALTNAARTNSSNSGKIVAELNDQRAKTLADAGMEAFMRARGQGQQEFEARRGGLANLYNLFATRASVAPDVSYQAQNVDGQNPQLMSQGSRQQMAAGEALAQAAGARGGVMDYIQPNYGWANAVGSGANALGSMFRGMSAPQGFGNGGSSTIPKRNDRLIGD